MVSVVLTLFSTDVKNIFKVFMFNKNAILNFFNKNSTIIRPAYLRSGEGEIKTKLRVKELSFYRYLPLFIFLVIFEVYVQYMVLKFFIYST